MSGVDDCDQGLMCWDVDPKTSIGICVPMCIGSENAPHCADPDRACSRGNLLAICLRVCHPVTQGCLDGQGCYPVNDDFICVRDAGASGTGAHGDACEYLNVCDPGLACLGAEFVGGSCNPASAGCCAAYCSVGGDGNCPAEGEVCTPWFDLLDAPPHYEDVGVCILPQ